MDYKTYMAECNETSEYCHSIVHEILALEAIITPHITYDDILMDEHQELWDELAECVGEQPSFYQPSVFDYVNLYCLELITLGERSSAANEWSVVGARLLRTYGGPNAYIEWHDTDFLVVQVYWGNETTEVRILAPNVAASIEDIASVVS